MIFTISPQFVFSQLEKIEGEMCMIDETLIVNICSFVYNIEYPSK